MKSMLVCGKFIALIGLLLLSVGCTENNKASELGSEDHIRAVVNEEFNGPNEQLNEIFTNLDPNQWEQCEKSMQKLEEYIQKNLKPHYSEQEYDAEEALNSSYHFVHTAHHHGYEIEVKDLNVEESRTTPDTYDFTATVAYTYTASNQTKTMDVMGTADTSEDGKITGLDYWNDQELMNALEVDPGEQNIQAVLQHTFNGPSEELEEIWDHLDHYEFGSDEYKKTFSRFGRYQQEKFKPYLTERFYEGYVINTNMGFSALRMAYSNDLELATEDIRFEESEKTENSYNFTVRGSYRDIETQDKHSMAVRGIINTNEAGKVVRIHYHNFENLRIALERNSATTE
ncbi:hypothetical protein EQV77_05040 [Halobacillus fulvus]|nr:hypothetical protein EQV77_05040 [Halobacillus fulvus]